MFKRFVCCLCAALLCACAVPPALAQHAPAPQSPAAQAQLDPVLDGLFARYAAKGACVAIFQNGEVTHVYCYGVRGAGQLPVTPDTAFQCGSISKLVANIGLMQLLRQQHIALDSDLGTLLGFDVRHPQYPNTPVTLRQLMTHTAALRDSGDYDLATAGSPLPLPQLFGARAGYTFLPDTEPGFVREYSNLGGGLIGSLIEKLSGLSPDDYLQQHVFAPLGVTAAFLPARLPQALPVADVYRMPDGVITRRVRQDSPVAQPLGWQQDYFLTAGKLVISAPHLARILIALCDEGVAANARILAPADAQQIITPQNRVGSVACDTGHGLFLNINRTLVQGRTLCGHGGKAYGMLCAAYFDPADRTGVVMLTNGCAQSLTAQGDARITHAVLTACYAFLDEHHTPVPLYAVD